ncbi:CABP7 protein, partial [Dryoscopus gambensis]|nr:CABP7 protein [Dryoscopus gambensis]
MPFHPVTAALMYRGIYTVPNILAEQRPEEVWGTGKSIPWDAAVGEPGGAFPRRRGEAEGERDADGWRRRRRRRRRRGRRKAEGEACGGDGQVDFEEFVTLLGPKLSTSGIPEKFHGTDFDTVFWKCDMQKLTVDELKRLLYDTFCEHLSMKDIENIIMTEEESHMGTAEECPVDVETCSSQQIRQTCVRKSLICAFAIAFIISVMLIAANQVLRSGMK